MLPIKVLLIKKCVLNNYFQSISTWSVFIIQGWKWIWIWTLANIIAYRSTF